MAVDDVLDDGEPKPGTAFLPARRHVDPVIVGEFPAPAQRLKPEVRKRSDGSCLADGALPLEKLSEVFPAIYFPSAEKRDYSILEDFVIARLNHPPREAETFDEQGLRFEILDMEGDRVDKVLVTPVNSGSPLLVPGARPKLEAAD